MLFAGGGYDDGESLAAWMKGINKVITGLTLAKEEENKLIFTFADGTKMQVWDDGQSCCEARYMTTDDDLEYYVGATLLGGEIKSTPGLPTEDDYGNHDLQFLSIKTSKGEFIMETRNEHNGYYGGFSVKAEILEEASDGRN